MQQSLSRSMRLRARDRAADITMLRDAEVPNPKAVLTLPPCRTEIRSVAAPSRLEKLQQVS